MNTGRQVGDDLPAKLNSVFRQRTREEGLLRRAFEAGRIEYRLLPQLPLPFYDSALPLAELRLGQWSGVTLKLRICDARRGVLPVEPFIRSLARSTVARLIFEQSIEIAIAARRSWPTSCPILIEAQPEVLLQDGVCAAIGRLVAGDPETAQDLVIAVDETAMLQRPEDMLRTLMDLRHHGLQTGILGFGSNYGALMQAIVLKPHVIGFDLYSFLDQESGTCGQTLAIKHLVAALIECLPATHRLATAVSDEQAAAAACAARLSHAQGTWMQPLYTASEVGRALAGSAAGPPGDPGLGTLGGLRRRRLATA